MTNNIQILNNRFNKLEQNINNLKNTAIKNEIEINNNNLGNTLPKLDKNNIIDIIIIIYLIIIISLLIKFIIARSRS